jgi:hypothetical protein
MTVSEALDIELVDVQTMYRAVFSDAVRDLGYGTDTEARKVKTWMSHDGFEVCCSLANWHPEWIRDMLNSLMIIDQPVRKLIVSDCLKIMRGVIRVTGRPDVAPVSIGSLNRRLEGDEEMKYLGGPLGLLSKASKESHKRRRESGDTE